MPETKESALKKGITLEYANGLTPIGKSIAPKDTRGCRRHLISSSKPCTRHRSLHHNKMATLRVVLKACSVSAGQGPDHQVLRHWAFLPDEGLRCLLLILGSMESGSMPIQALMVYVGLMPKPAGGERPIGLTAMLYRLIMRLEKMLLAEWDEKFAGFWDDAVKGSSPLRAAILRSLRVEVAKILGYEAIGLLWDITAFFDEVDIALLIPLALSRGFCPWTLGLAVKVHMGPRAFKEGKYISSWMESSGCSILAGCITSVSLTRALLYDVLDDMHRSCPLL